MAINLSNLTKNSPKAPRIIIHGDPGVGKTTFAACAPSPVIIQTEDGLGNLDATAFPLATSFQDVLDALGSLYTCLLYTSDAADDLLCVDLGGRRIIKKKTEPRR